jgi:hypothetical protein
LRCGRINHPPQITFSPVLSLKIERIQLCFDKRYWILKEFWLYQKEPTEKVPSAGEELAIGLRRSFRVQK